MIVARLGGKHILQRDFKERDTLLATHGKGVRPMGKALPKSDLGRKTRHAPLRQTIEKAEMQALDETRMLKDTRAPKDMRALENMRTLEDMRTLEEENARLRELVTQLSEIVIKNIVDAIEDG